MNIKPVLGGSSRDHLKELWIEIREKALELNGALARAYPHPRDYQALLRQFDQDKAEVEVYISVAKDLADEAERVIDRM